LKKVTIDDESEIHTGSTFRVEIAYESNNNGATITEFGVSIWDSNHYRLISISSLFKCQISDFNNTGTVACEIPNLPLVKGQYQINAFVSSIFGLEDYIENIMGIEVHENDIFAHGRTVNPEWGKIAVDHNWIKQQ